MKLKADGGLGTKLERQASEATKIPNAKCENGNENPQFFFC